MANPGMDLAALEALITPLLDQERAELVDLQYLHESGRWVLKLFIDKAGGVKLDDCAYFSDRIGALLDSSDVIHSSYVLEVSSPGIDRRLRKEGDFKRFAGKSVKVRLRSPIEGGRRNFKGTLRGYEDGQVLLEADGEPFRLPAAEIAEARLDEEVRI